LVSGSDIEAFRPLRLEWHNLIPDNIQDFDTLVATEIEITKALIQFEEGRSGNHRGTRFTSYETWVEGKDFSNSLKKYVHYRAFVPCVSKPLHVAGRIPQRNAFRSSKAQFMFAPNLQSVPLDIVINGIDLHYFE